MTSPESQQEPLATPHAIAVRALFLRIRFLLIIALLAMFMAAWPWMRTVWERVVLSPISASGNHAVSIDSEFFCPMDPGIHSAWPSICPICNMDLIVRKKTDAVILPEGVLARMQLSPYRVQLAGVRTDVVQTHPVHANTVMIPVSAVVHRDSGPIVYVETMAGMYDALPVALGDKQNDQYEILSGLQAGQKVVSTGAFLIDAETRLNPSLAVQYFGANRHHANSTAPALADRRIAKTTGTLSPADQTLIDQQRICPVTKAPLGSMGQPVFVMVDGHKIAICCEGCEAALLKDKEKYLALLKSAAAAEPPTP